MIARSFRVDPGLVAAALLPLIGILPTLADGVINTADGPLHVHRIHAMSVMLGQGVLWPRWIPWFHVGFGYPIFNYYPPGVFYLGGLLGQLRISAPAAFTIIATLAWIVGSVGAYRLAKRVLPPYGALLAAMLWAYAPSRLFEVWDQGSLPQMMAAALVPWLFDGIATVARQPTRRGLIAIALPLAGIVLCHQPITFITALYTLPLAIILPLWAGRHERETIPRRLIHVFAGLTLGATLCAIFLIPLVAELRFVQASRGAEDNVDYLRSNFLQVSEIFAQPLPVDLTDLRLELPTTLGLVGGALALVGLIALAVRRRGPLLALLLVGLAFTLFMLVEPSLPVWLGIPYFRQLRFPERFLRVGALIVAVAGGASLLLLPRRWQLPGLVAGLIVTLAAALPLVYPNQRFVTWENLSAVDEIEFEGTYYVWGTTSYDEFDPLWGEDIPLPTTIPDQDAYATDPTRLVVYRVDMARYGDIMQVLDERGQTTRIRLAQPHAVRFQQYYFPGWTATLNGQPVEIEPDPQFGLITVNAPAGEHEIALAYAGTTAQAVGAAITLAGIAVVGVLAFVPARGQPRVCHAEPLDSRVALGVGAAVVAFAVVNTYVIAPGTLWLRHRSPPDAPIYMQSPVHVGFGDAFDLLGYTLEQREADPGGLFSITLFWRARETLDRAYRPVVQLVNLNVTEAWGASEPFFPGGGPTIGYPPDRFASEIHELRVFPTAPPYVARVSVQMIDVETGAALRLPDGADRLLLDPLIRIRGNGDPVTPISPATFDNRIRLDCADATRDGNDIRVRLFWHVLSPPDTDLVTFVHGLDGAGQIAAQGDAPPLQGNYPTSLWLAGQNLADSYTLADAGAVREVAVGLYNRADNRRLPAQRGSRPLPDDRVIVPIGGPVCLP